MDKTSSREQKLGREYDLVVIGGGFHGACAFEEAAARGVNALLLERGDFCSGASANSLKTVHGGIRYLQSGDIRRLRLTAKARGLWASRAPRLMRSLPCVAPLPRKFVASAPFVRLGTLAYQLLTMNRRRVETPGLVLAPPSVVSRDRYKELASPFCDHHAEHGLLWEDYQVSDSERLVMDTIRLGEQYGGHAINYVEALETVTGKSAASEITVCDRITDRQFSIRTRSTVAFTGSAPGDSEFLAHTGGSRSRPVLAVNVVIGRPLASRGVAFNAVAGSRNGADRYLFCVPWNNSTILGTWYWHAPGPEGPTVDPHRLADLAEVLQDINSSLDGTHITDDDITRIHWGWLPGNWDQASDPEASLLKHASILTATGGAEAAACTVVEGTKFTTANIVALEGLKSLGLTGERGRFERESWSRFISPVVASERLEAFESEARSIGLSAEVTDRLVNQYGDATSFVLEIAQRQPEFAKPVIGVPASVQSEIVYCVLYEQAMHLSDVIFRRTGIGGSGLPQIGTLDCCAGVMARFRDWNDDEVEKQIRRILEQPYDGRWVNT